MKKEFIPFPSTKFAEIFQNHQIKFAFVQETPTAYTQLHGSVNCRDFLADVLHAEDIKEYFAIYGFSWNPEKKQIDRDATKLVMHFETSEQLEELKKNLHILHEWESRWKLRKTKILTVDEKTAIIKGSSFYLRKGFAISLYTYLLKCYSLTDNFANLTGNELNYYTQCGSNFEKLLINFRKVLARKGSICGVSNGSDSTIHNYAGFVAVCCHPSYQIYGKYLNKL